MKKILLILLFPFLGFCQYIPKDTRSVSIEAKSENLTNNQNAKINLEALSDLSGRYVGKEGEIYYELAIYKTSDSKYEGFDIFITSLGSYIKAKVVGEIKNNKLVYNRFGTIERKLLKGGANGEDLNDKDAGDIISCTSIVFTLNIKETKTGINLVGSNESFCGAYRYSSDILLDKGKEDLTFINPNNDTKWKTGDFVLINWNQTFPPGKINLEILKEGVNIGYIVKDILRNANGGYYWKIPDSLAKSNLYQVKLSTTRRDGSEREFVSYSNYFKISNFNNGVTLVTHGFQLFGYSDLENWTVREDKSKGQISFCEAIKKRVELEGGSASIYINDVKNPGKWILKDGKGKITDEQILFFNWSKSSNDGLLNNDDGDLEASADYLFALLNNLKSSNGEGLPSNIFESSLPFHFIGHSRGTVLLLQLLHRISEYFPQKQIEHLTLLDAHPATPMKDIVKSNQNLSLPGVFGETSNFPSENLKLKILPNVKKCDTYLRQSIYYESLDPIWDFTDFSGITVEGANNRYLINEDLENGATPIKILGVNALKTAHTAVPEWYIGTMVPSDPSFSTEKRANWYNLSRERFGYNQSRVGGALIELKTQSLFATRQEYDIRILNRSESPLNAIFNSNFNYFKAGWQNYGGKFYPLSLNLNKNKLSFQKTQGLGLDLPFIKHNHMFFSPNEPYLALKISSINNSNKLNISFYDILDTKVGNLTIRVPSSNTYFVKIPEKLLGQSGSFSVSLDGTSSFSPVQILQIFCVENEVVEPQLINLKWRNSENTLSPVTLGVAADGTSRLLISIGNEIESSVLNINRATKVLINIKDQDGTQNISKYIGSLKSINNLSQLLNPLEVSHSEEIVVVNSIKLSNQYYFDYQAPVDFNRTYEGMDDSQKSSRSVILEITLLDASNQEIGKYRKEISIVRPPLMLAHGLGGKGVGKKPEDSSESTWREFKYLDSKGNNVYFRNSNLFLDKRDINLLPTASFDANSDVLLGKNESMVNESFDAMIKRMNDQGYACAKVDYVAHSMGGSVLRNTLEKPEYKNPKNYNQGYVNKFITICTPHQGSPLGDIVSEFSNYIKYVNSVDKTQLAGLNLILKYWIKDKSNNWIASDAILDLATIKGKKFSDFNIPNHQIVGNFPLTYTTASEAMVDIISKNIKEVPGLVELAETMIKAAKVKFSSCLCINEKNEIDRIDQILNKPLKTVEFFDWYYKRSKNTEINFTKNSDFIVSVESQSNGAYQKLPINYLELKNSPVTFFDNITHNFNPKATYSTEVGNKVFGLLNKDIGSSNFNKILKNTNNTNSFFSCSESCNLGALNNSELIKVYPNPTSNNFNLDLTEIPNFESGTLSISDDIGVITYEAIIDKTCCKDLKVTFPKGGIYTILIKTTTETFSKKIAINK